MHSEITNLLLDAHDTMSMIGMTQELLNTMKQNDTCDINLYKFLPFLSFAIYGEIRIMNTSVRKSLQLLKLQRLYDILLP